MSEHLEKGIIRQAAEAESAGEASLLTRMEKRLNLVRYRKALSRRSFLEGVGVASLGVASISVLNGCLGGSAAAAAVSETDVLNFALNLEYLEAEFYNVAVTGSTLSGSVTGGPSKAMGGNKVNFTTPRYADIAAQIAQDEREHVMFLRSALASAAVPEPAINLDALGIGFASEAQFLTLARAFEDTGVSAYAGAATLLTGMNLQAAAQILATEAYHAGNIRLDVVEAGLTVPPTDRLDIPPDEAHFFPVDRHGLAVKRTTSQVLAIVYAKSAPGTSRGGFFPNGLNGNIKTV